MTSAADPMRVHQIDRGRRPHADRLIVAVFVISGAAGLIYQIVWSRDLVLVFGNTSQAIGTIVAAFMAGLGLGGLVGGLLAPRLQRPLLFYGLVELSVAGAALLVPFGFNAIEGVYGSAYATTPPAQLAAVRLVLTMGVITPATFLMGLTLPLLTRHLVDSMRTAGARMGQLYGANTLGAMFGTLVSGFVLVELLGLSATAEVGIGLNLLCGATAVLLGVRRVIDAPAAAEVEAQPGEDQARLGLWLRRLLYAITFVSGFVALALELLWVRMLSEGTGSQIYSFAIILAVYLLGIALGGAAYRALSRPGRDTLTVLALAVLGIAVSAVVTVPGGTLWLGPSYWVRAVIMLPATFCMGYAFPLMARLLTGHPNHGARSIGVLYAWNTLGSILGSLAATFLLATTLGTNASILILAAADAAAGLTLIILGAGPRRVPSISAATIAAGQIALILTSSFLVASGSPLLETATEHWLDAHHRPYHHVEDDLSTVDAEGGAPAQRVLYTSGTGMTALSVDTKLMAYLPKVVRPNASSFLDIAFGMGTTYRSALRLGMRTDAVDLSPSVPNQMSTFYPDASTYLHNPRGRIITADGRNYVHLTSRRYDIISVDPPPPIQAAGAVVLYTRQFYADARRTLKPGGVMLEWLYFGVTLNDLREHVRTFSSEFRYVDILISPLQGGVYMLGSQQPIGWNAGTVSRFMGTRQAAADIESAPDYRRIAGRHWPDVLNDMRWLQGGAVDRFAGNALLITDDHPRTEYYLLQHTFGPPADRHYVNARELRRLRV